MKITVTPEAQAWFKNEVGMKPGDAVGFFGKVYGKTAIHEGFSMGMTVGPADDALYATEINGLTYYIEKNDEWFFNGYDLEIDYAPKTDEPIYNFTANVGR